MARRRPMVIIQSIKHYVHQNTLLIASGAIQNFAVADAVVAPAVGNAFDVAEGSVLKAVYIELWVIGASTTGTSSVFNMTIEKVPSNAPLMTFAQSQNLGAYANKKNILYVTQGIITAQIDGANPIPMHRAWILIPKGKQRMGAGDSIRLNVSAIADIRVCGIFTYKEYK